MNERPVTTFDLRVFAGLQAGFRAAAGVVDYWSANPGSKLVGLARCHDLRGWSGRAGLAVVCETVPFDVDAFSLSGPLDHVACVARGCFLWSCDADRLDASVSARTTIRWLATTFERASNRTALEDVVNREASCHNQPVSDHRL